MRNKSLIALSLIVSLAGFDLEARESSSITMQGFELLKCNQAKVKKCIKVIANEAQSGNVTPLMTLRDVEVQINQKNVTRVKKGSFAYYSPEDEKIVVTLQDNSDFQLNLKDLSEVEFN